MGGATGKEGRRREGELLRRGRREGGEGGLWAEHGWSTASASLCQETVGQPHPWTNSCRYSCPGTAVALTDISIRRRTPWPQARDAGLLRHPRGAFPAQGGCTIPAHRVSSAPPPGGADSRPLPLA